MSGWSTEFNAGLRGTYGRGRNDMVFVIRTRPFVGGQKWMPYAITPEGHRVAVTSVAPELIPGLSETDIKTDHYGGGGLVSYKETAASVALRSWQTKLASFSFVIADGDDHWGKYVVKMMPRGMMISVDAGFSDWAWDEFQRINIGTVRQVTNQNGSFVVTCDEIFSAMTGPGGTAARSHAVYQSFVGAGSTFTIDEAVSSDENAIDASPTTMTAYAATDLRGGKDNFVVQTTDTADPPNTVYLRCDLSDRSTGTIYRDDGDSTGLMKYDWFKQSIGHNESESVSYPAGGVISADTAAKMFYVVDDNFFDTFLRILTSTGSYGTGEQNGDWDTLHGALGFGVPLEMVWWLEINAWHNQWAGRNLSDWDWTPFFGSEVENGWSEISKALQNFGMWPVMKEGEISLRSAISHCEDLEGYGSRYDIVTDDNIESIKKHDWFSTNCRTEFFFMKQAIAREWGEDAVTAHDPEFDSMTIETRPFADTFEISTVNGPRHYAGARDPDVTTCWAHQDDDGSDGARTFVSQNAAWYTRIPEYAEIVTAGMRYAHLCPGDIVLVTSKYLHGPEGTWESRPAMVQSVHRDWINGRVTLGLAALPTKTNRYT